MANISGGKYYDKYKIGGLESTAEDSSVVLDVDGKKYVFGEKFKAMLRDSLIDWGTFLEIYNKNTPNDVAFEQICRLLNVKDNQNVKDIMLPIIKKIYALPSEMHLISMMRQYMIYEPVSIVIYSLFTTLKIHFEDVVRLFIEVRNEFIDRMKCSGYKNNWDKLVEEWRELDVNYELSSSSIVLLFLNPPKDLRSGIHWRIEKIDGEEEEHDEIYELTGRKEHVVEEKEIDEEGIAMLESSSESSILDLEGNVEEDVEGDGDEKQGGGEDLEKVKNAIDELKTAVGAFHYMGFCPKVPHVRLKALLEFPLNAFINAILLMKSSVKLPNYTLVEQELEKFMKNKPLKPAFLDNIPRQEPPPELLGRELKSKERDKIKLPLIKWYVDRIMELRKGLLTEGEKYENYYKELAKFLNEISKKIKSELSPYTFSVMMGN